MIKRDKDLEKLNPEAKIHGVDGRTVGDFWQWAYSDLLQNTTRGVFAEYLLSVLLGIDDIPRNPWDAYDLRLPDGTTIEVKTMSRLQAWAQKQLSKPMVVMAPTRKWDPLTGEMQLEPSFNADIYAFCYFTADSHDTADVLDSSQWEFFIFSRAQIEELFTGRKSVSLDLLLKNGFKPVTAAEVEQAIQQLIPH